MIQTKTINTGKEFTDAEWQETMTMFAKRDEKLAAERKKASEFDADNSRYVHECMRIIRKKKKIAKALNVIISTMAGMLFDGVIFYLLRNVFANLTDRVIACIFVIIISVTLTIFGFIEEYIRNQINRSR